MLVLSVVTTMWLEAAAMNVSGHEFCRHCMGSFAGRREFDGRFPTVCMSELPVYNAEGDKLSTGIWECMWSGNTHGPKIPCTVGVQDCKPSAAVEARTESRRLNLPVAASKTVAGNTHGERASHKSRIYAAKAVPGKEFCDLCESREGRKPKSVCVASMPQFNAQSAETYKGDYTCLWTMAEVNVHASTEHCPDGIQVCPTDGAGEKAGLGQPNQLALMCKAVGLLALFGAGITKFLASQESNVMINGKAIAMYDMVPTAADTAAITEAAVRFRLTHANDPAWLQDDGERSMRKRSTADAPMRDLEV
jgi:hypothetical protein